MRWLTLVTLIGYTLHIIFAFNHQNEAVYKWNAVVRAGTYLPVPHASMSTLTGKIHFKSTSDTTYAKISNLNYKLYNGPLDHVQEHQAHDLPLPEEANEIENVFQIVYNDGLVAKILTQKDEKEFSRNVKRAIASIFQMNSSIVSRTYQHPETFIGRENSLHGNIIVEHSIYPSENGQLEVHKLYDMANTRVFRDISADARHSHCEVKPEHPVMQNSKRIYTVVTNNENRVVTHIRAVGTIVYHPYQAKSDAQIIFVDQKFELVKDGPKNEEYHLDPPLSELDLTYHPHVLLNSGLLDESNGRHTPDYEIILPQIRQLLADISAYLQQNHIKIQGPDTKHEQLINRVQRLLTRLDAQKLHELHKSLQQDTLDIFIQVLPLISTPVSALYIKDLIIKNEVNDEIAVELLQKLPDYFSPSTKLLGDLEDLIHLNDSYSWEVRKVAILSFSTLIYRSYLFAKEHALGESEDDLQSPYQKYVDEYVARLQGSNEYKVQMVYTFALFNIRLPITLKYLIPALNGEYWSDQHLRLLSLWAASASLLDSGSVFETFWPIFSNRNELVEIRLIAFYYIMHSQPSHFRLNNLFTYLITETEKEVYSYCYSYLQSVLKSTNPCNEELRLKIAQMLKFSPPPRGGLSSVKHYGYTDSKFGFGSEIQYHVINTNRSHLHAVFLLSHEHDKYQRDRMFFVKIHDGRPGDATSIFSLYKPYVERVIIKGDSPHIEGVFLKRDKVVNTLYVDENTSLDIQRTQQWLFQDDDVRKTFLDIHYQQHQRVLIPTDIGFPAMWEFLQPQVTQNNIIRITKRLNYEFGYRYVNWIHFHHGLSFYNPLGDIWQGVGRYHCYDEAWPFSFKWFWNSVGSVGVSWEKNGFFEKNTGGVRSHVKQMVFAKSENQHDILEQSSPHSKPFHVVSDGKRFRHDYNLIDVDDFNTGHKLYVSLFDSDVHVSNGSFKHQVTQFAQTYTKQIHTPIDHLILSLMNWRQYTMIMPDPGTHGFILQVVPSQKYDISNINLSFYMGLKHEDFQLKYDIESNNQILKSWVANLSVEINLGYTFEKFKLNLTRVIPKQQDYRICVDGFRKTTREISGHFSISMGQINKDVCPHDSDIEVDVIAKRSLEQTDGNHKYLSCQYVVPYFFKPFNTAECSASPDTLRRSEYHVKTKNLSNELKKSATNWWNRLVRYYQSYYTFEEQNNDNLGNEDLQVEIEFPMQANEIDVHVGTSQNLHHLSGIPAGYWSWFGVSADNVTSPRQLFRLFGDEAHLLCTVYFDRQYFNDTLVSKEVPRNWTLYVDRGGVISIYAKATSNNTLAMKAVTGDVILEVNPYGESFQIVVNGKQKSITEYFQHKWFIYRPYVDFNLPSDFLFKIGFGVEYDTNCLKFFGYRSFDGGLCSQKQNTVGTNK